MRDNAAAVHKPEAQSATETKTSPIQSRRAPPPPRKFLFLN